MATRWIVIVSITFAIIALVVLALAPLQTIEVQSHAKHEFTINEPMERVRKILVRTNAIKTIVAMADAELKDQQWLNLTLENNARLLDRDWELKGEGQLVVVSNNTWLGRPELTMDQRINVKPERLESQNTLNQLATPIQGYDSILLLTPEANGDAHFATTLKIVIVTRTSWLARGLVQSRIQTAAKEALITQENALRSIVREHEGKLLILPEGLGE